MLKYLFINLMTATTDKPDIFPKPARFFDTPLDYFPLPRLPRTII
jgi:hypothetical protein